MNQQWAEDFSEGGRCYRILPPSHASSPGYRGLIVTLHGPAFGFPSVIETLHIRLRDDEGLASWCTLDWRSDILKNPLTLCMGRLTLCERSDRRIVFFSFGGALVANVQTEQAVCEIHSTAPILGVTFPLHASSAQLAAEAEALLAEAEARWEPNEDGFFRRLAELDPLRCYQAVLQSLYSRYEQVAALRETLQPLYEIIHREMEWFRETGQWPQDAVGLEELLTPP